jgi:1,4-dihydroxy-2-naphthoate octaprenyltransferase
MSKYFASKKNAMMGVIKAGRFHLYTLKLSCIFLGVAIAYTMTGQFSITGILLALVIGLFSHGASSISNEWADVPIDASQGNRTFISGGSGSASGGLVERDYLLAGWIISTILALTLVVIAIFLFQIHWIILLFTFIGLLLALGYSLPPFKFSRRGLGEIAALIAYSVPIFFGIIVLQVDKSLVNPLLVSYKPYLFTIPPAVSIFSLLSLTQIPDIETDKKAGKISIAIIIGAKNVLFLAVISMILCVFCFFVFTLFGMLHIVFAGLASIPPVVTIIMIFRNTASVEKPKPEMMKSLVYIFKVSAYTALLCSIIPAIGLLVFPVQLV